jgi:uncharacterized protein YbaP (TraB family)
MLAAGAALALFTPVAACAQPSPPAAAATDADPALWVVRDDDTTIYLFGTVHVLKPGLTWFDEAVKKAFDTSDTLLTEIQQPDPAVMQPLMMRLGTDASQPPLSGQLPEKLRATYIEQMAAIGIPQAVADRFKPWLAATILSVAPLQKLGYQAEVAPEAVLDAAATKAGKTHNAFETVEEQFGILSGLPHDAQMDFLISTLEDIDQIGPLMAEMVDDWSNGDPRALAALLNEELTETPTLEKVLLTDRNARWATRIAERMEKPGTVFIAVGAGHLAGDGSVQADLAKHGITATRVEY